MLSGTLTNMQSSSARCLKSPSTHRGEQEVLDLPLDIAATRVGVVLQPAAVAHLGVEHLAGGEGLTKVCFPHTATSCRLRLQTLSN